MIDTVKNKSRCLSPNIEFALGLGYGSYLCNSEWYFDLSAGYDFHYYWNQNMIKPLIDGSRSQIESEAGGLMLHSLTITARLDF